MTLKFSLFHVSIWHLKLKYDLIFFWGLLSLFWHETFVKLGFYDKVTGLWAFEVQMPCQKYTSRPILVRLFILYLSCLAVMCTFIYLSKFMQWNIMPTNQPTSSHSYYSWEKEWKWCIYESRFRLMPFYEY